MVSRHPSYMTAEAETNRRSKLVENTHKVAAQKWSKDAMRRKQHRQEHGHECGCERCLPPPEAECFQLLQRGRHTIH